MFEVYIAATGFVRALCRGHADITGAALHRYLPGLGLSYNIQKIKYISALPSPLDILATRCPEAALNRV